MAWWDSSAGTGGDQPANALTAAWRRILVPRLEVGQAQPTVIEALTAYAASLRAADLAPRFERLTLTCAGGVVRRFHGREPHPPELRAAFDEAVVAMIGAYQGAFARPPTPMELADVFDFVLRPNPAALCADAAVELVPPWSLVADPDVARAGPAPALAPLQVHGAVFDVDAAEVERLLALARGPVPAITLYTAEPVADETTTIIRQTGGDWSPDTFAALSHATGGWTLALSRGGGRRSTVIAWYAGRVVERVEVDEPAGWQQACAWYRLIADHEPWELDRPRRPGERSLPGAAPAAAPDAMTLPALHRGVIASCELSRARAAATATGSAGARWVERSTPVAAIPYLIIDGDFDDDWLLALAERLGVAAVGFCLGATAEGRASIRGSNPTADASAPGPIGVERLTAALGGLAITMGEPPAILRAPPPAPRPPGLFAVLVRAGTVDVDALRPLLARLPPDDELVLTGARGGEAFDSLRWPLACNAALATWIAGRFDDPDRRLADTELDIHACDGDPGRLRALRRDRLVRRYASAGLDRATIRVIHPDATDAELALVDEPRWPADLAEIAADLVVAHDEASDGLYAYHVTRGDPGPSAEAAARLATRALVAGRLTVARLVEEACQVRWPAADRSDG